MQPQLKIADQTERAICAAICRGDGIKAREIAKQLNLDRTTVTKAVLRATNVELHIPNYTHIIPLTARV